MTELNQTYPMRTTYPPIPFVVDIWGTLPVEPADLGRPLKVKPWHVRFIDDPPFAAFVIGGEPSRRILCGHGHKTALAAEVCLKSWLRRQPS